MAQAFEAHLSMLDYTMESDTVAGNETKEYVVCELDTADYDGNALYYFEGVIRTTGGTGTCEFWERGGGSALASISTTNGASTRVRSTAFTPTTGSAIYEHQIDAGTSRVRIHRTEIVVVQDSTATKTALLIPMGGDQGSITSTTYADPPGDRRPLWLYESAKWANATFTLDFAGNNNDGTKTISCRIVDTLGNQVGEVSVTGQGTTTDWDRAESSAMTLVDGRTYYAQFKVSGGTGKTGRVSIRVVISTLTTAQSYLKPGWSNVEQTGDRSNSDGGSSANANTDVVGQRILLTKTNYGNLSAIFFEGCGQDAGSSGDIRLTDMGTADSAGTVTEEVTVNITSTTPQRVRSADINADLTDGNRFNVRLNSLAADRLDFISSYLIIEVTPPAAGAAFTPRVMMIH